MIPEAYRTLANSPKYAMNMGTQRTTFYAQGDDKKKDKEEKEEPIIPTEPEKVQQFDYARSRTRTSYYGQNQAQTQAKQEAPPKKAVKVASGFDANIPPEKVQYLVPESYRKTGHVINKFKPEKRTTFYVQQTKPVDKKLVMF